VFTLLFMLCFTTSWYSYPSPPNPFPLGLLLLLTTSALLLLLPLLLIPLMILIDFKPHTVSPLPSLPCRFLWKWFQVQVLNGTYHVSFLVGFPDSSRVADYRASAFVTSCIVEKGSPPCLCRLLCIFSLGEEGHNGKDWLVTLYSWPILVLRGTCGVLVTLVTFP
jgi:hypothetical protein